MLRKIAPSMAVGAVAAVVMIGSVLPAGAVTIDAAVSDEEPFILDATAASQTRDWFCIPMTNPDDKACAGFMLACVESGPNIPIGLWAVVTCISMVNGHQVDVDGPYIP